MSRIDNLLNEILSNTEKRQQSRKIAQYPDLVEYLADLYPNYTLAEKVRFYRDGLTTEPCCDVCGGILNLSDRKTCSRKCRDELKRRDGTFKQSIAKATITNMEKYGVSNPMQLAEYQEKRLSTIFAKYGAYVSDKAREATRSRAHDMNIKARKTLKEKYNVENPGQLPDHGKKCKITTMQNYGVESYYNSAEYKERQKIKRIEHWDKIADKRTEIKDVLSDKRCYPTERITYECECGTSEVISHETLKWRIAHTGVVCAACGGLNRGSSSEQDVAVWLQGLGFDLQTNTRLIIRPLELDIYLPEHNLAIEFNGSYWHSELHGKDKHYHLNKTNLCKEQGIHLIHIWEHDWILKKDLIKSRIKAKLGSNERVYARKCVIQEINSLDSSAFLENNHIQGSCPASVRYGLFYQDELIAVMTFGKSRYKKDVEYELLRYCSKQGINVVGGASRLFKKFISAYSPKSIISYSGRMWNTGALYEKLGFAYSHSTLPAYYYTKNYLHFENRVVYQKHKLKDKLEIFDPLLTEWENMQAAGYDRIWDCGNDVWIFSL